MTSITIFPTAPQLSHFTNSGHHHPHHQKSASLPNTPSHVDTNPKLYYVSMPRQVTFTETIIEEDDDGVDNPFRPGGGLSKEAEIIVQLIKAGKPISPLSPTKEDIAALEEWKREQERRLHPELYSNNVDNTSNLSTTTKTELEQQRRPNRIVLTVNGNNNTTIQLDGSNNMTKSNGNNNINNNNTIFVNSNNTVKSSPAKSSKKSSSRKKSSSSSTSILSPSNQSSPLHHNNNNHNSHHNTSSSPNQNVTTTTIDSSIEKKNKVCCVIQ